MTEATPRRTEFWIGGGGCMTKVNEEVVMLLQRIVEVWAGAAPWAHLSNTEREEFLDRLWAAIPPHQGHGWYVSQPDRHRAEVPPSGRPVLLESEPFDFASAFAAGVYRAPDAGWYSINGGQPVKLTDDEVREMGFEPG